jgi:glycosyltransferase involved in cell wall biosynthesis
MPLVSICIPTYNGASYLEACLDSALAQTFPDFEVLIVDDQSTDQSYQIAQAYATRDPRIRVARNTHNLGLVGNWNQCVLLAQGEWVKFLFQDDILEPNCVERMLTVCGPNKSMVVCKRKIIFGDDSKDLRERFLWYIQKYDMDKIFPSMTVIPPGDFCKAVLNNSLGNFVGEPTAVLLHRSVFGRFGFFNPHLVQICDLEYWIRVGLHTGFIYVPEILVHFRRHSKGTSVANENSRRFRTYIDQLICYHDFVFHPLYAPLRFYASQCEPPVNLNQWFADKVKDAHKIARMAAKDGSNPDPSLLEEMSEITRLFPGFRIVKKIPFSLRYGKYRWKIQNLFSNHLNIKR